MGERIEITYKGMKIVYSELYETWTVPEIDRSADLGIMSLASARQKIDKHYLTLRRNNAVTMLLFTRSNGASKEVDVIEYLAKKSGARDYVAIMRQDAGSPRKVRMEVGLHELIVINETNKHLLSILDQRAAEHLAATKALRDAIEALPKATCADIQELYDLAMTQGE